jgi:hypothetical protein
MKSPSTDARRLQGGCSLRRKGWEYEFLKILAFTGGEIKKKTGELLTGDI